VSLDDKINFLMKINEAALKVPNIIRVQSNMAFDYEWKYLATSEGSYLEQEIWRTAPGFTVTALKDGKSKQRTFSVAPKTAGYEVVLEAKMLENVERICAEGRRTLHGASRGRRAQGPGNDAGPCDADDPRDRRTPTELDRVVGYEANYAGTSFVTKDDIGKRMMGSKLFNVTCDRTLPGGMCTVGYDDDGVKSQSWPIIKEGRLIDLQTNRETAHYIGQDFSRGCTFATSWRNYPFLRMPNVHVEPGPPGSPTPDQIIADTKDGILIDGRGSYSIDQQRFNGQFGGDAFWEIKNGKKTRMLSDVTYNAITTDFWQNLDATSGKEHWEMFGTTGDAKGSRSRSIIPLTVHRGCASAGSWLARPTARPPTSIDPERLGCS
jgi:TldD protein